MTLYLLDFWNKFDAYPQKLTYYDKTQNIQDIITDKIEMDEFCEKNSDCEVIDFAISFKENYIYVEIE